MEKNMLNYNEAEIVQLLTKLEELLDRESNALAGPLSDNLYSLAQEKEKVLTELGGYTKGQRVSFIDKRIVEKLRYCQRINDENKSFVNQRLKVIREAAQIIRSESGTRSLELYDGGGKLVHVNKSKQLTEV